MHIASIAIVKLCRYMTHVQHFAHIMWIMKPSIYTHVLYGRLTQGAKRAMLQAQRQTLGVTARSLELERET